MYKNHNVLWIILSIIFITSCVASSKHNQGWVSLFNGKDLHDWVIKINGHDVNDNYLDTFIVEDSLLKVSYKNYKQFDDKFGHIFYKTPYSHYIIRVEYRFVGEQVPGGPGWAFRNNGIMFHSQSPQSMKRDQEFPVSIEAQMLGGNGTDKRSTANVCSPGTHIEMDGKLIKKHCNNSKSKTFHGDQWVTMDVEVQGSDSIKHYVNGELVLEYQKPQLDGEADDAKPLLVQGMILDKGYIALQAESHPMEIRKIALKVLPDNSNTAVGSRANSTY